MRVARHVGLVRAFVVLLAAITASYPFATIALAMGPPTGGRRAVGVAP